MRPSAHSRAARGSIWLVELCLRDSWRLAECMEANRLVALLREVFHMCEESLGRLGGSVASIDASRSEGSTILIAGRCPIVGGRQALSATLKTLLSELRRFLGASGAEAAGTVWLSAGACSGDAVIETVDDRIVAVFGMLSNRVRRLGLECPGDADALALDSALCQSGASGSGVAGACTVEIVNAPERRGSD